MAFPRLFHRLHPEGFRNARERNNLPRKSHEQVAQLAGANYCFQSKFQGLPVRIGADQDGSQGLFDTLSATQHEFTALPH